MNEQEIQEYFEQLIKGFIYKDITSCIKAEANFVVALALLSYTEYLGGLCTGTLGISSNSESNFKEGLSRMSFNGDTNYYKDFLIKYKDENGKEENVNIYKIFRCGMAHEYFGKSMVTIHNNPDLNVEPTDPGIGWFTDENKVERLRLLTNAYFRDLQSAFEDLYVLVVDKKDPDAVGKFNESVTRIFSRSASRV